MLTFTADAINAMQRDGSEPVFELTIGAPVSKSISLVATDVPVLRVSSRPLSRTFELSTLSIDVDNMPITPGADPFINQSTGVGGSGFWFSEWDRASILNDGGGDPIDWHQATVTVKMGVKLPGGQTETQTVFTALLVDVRVHDNGRAELVCIDPLARLRRSSINSDLHFRDPDGDPVSGDETGRRYQNFPASYVVYDLLKQSGFGAFLNDPQFQDAIFHEVAEGFLQEELLIRSGTWWSQISAQLKIANAGLRWNAEGQLEYFTFRPEPAGASVAYLFEEGRNMTGLTVGKPDTHIVNSAVVTRSEGAGGSVETFNSPIEDHDSIAKHERRGQDIPTDYLDDYAAEKIAEERIYFQNEPFRVMNVQGAWDSFRVEIGDQVQIDAPKTMGLFGQVGTVFAKAISPLGGVLFLVIDTIFSSGGPYLFADNAQDLNDGQRVW